MENPCSEKLTYKYPPCRAPLVDQCKDYADDEFDPCYTSEDITDDDMGILLGLEETALREEGKQTEKEEEKRVVGKKEEEKRVVGKKEEKKNLESSRPGPKNQNDQEQEMKNNKTAETSVRCDKKRICRRLIKNPFYSNRLSFSSDLPPPPPEPPPQFFPLVEEVSSKAKICKKKKKCRTDDGSRGRNVAGAKGAGAIGAGAKGAGAKGAETEEAACEEEACEEAACEAAVGEEAACEEPAGEEAACEAVECVCEPECCLDLKYPKEVEIIRKKGGCKRRAVERPPCRKKVSEISVSLQPRQIPALQRNLPETSEREQLIAEKELMMNPPPTCTKKHRKKNCPK